MDTKQCKDCRATLPLYHFHKTPQTKDGHTGVCKDCRSKRFYQRRNNPAATGNTKLCRDCKSMLPLTDFSKNPKANDGLRPQCKVCTSKRRGQERRKSLVQRFWQWTQKTEDPGQCWLWIGYVSSYGYGYIGDRQKPLSAHRFSYELHYGPIPSGLFVCHACDVRRCVNPKHLWLGTGKDNMQDAKAKGRLVSGTRHISHLRPEWNSGEANGRTTLKNAEVRAIRALLPILPPQDIADLFHVSRSIIYSIRSGKTWKHLDAPNSLQ